MQAERGALRANQAGSCELGTRGVTSVTLLGYSRSPGVTRSIALCEIMSSGETPTRTPISHRLGSLLSSPSQSNNTSPRSSLDNEPSMLRTRSAASAVSRRKSKPPILHWLGSWSPYPNHSPEASGSQSGSASPSSTTSSTPPSPNLASLQEALNESLLPPRIPISTSLLPARPPRAKLPDAFFPHALSRPPPFLDNLTRSTLPTASLSPPDVSAQNYFPPSPQDSSASVLDFPPILLTHSKRSSLDTLRSVSQRDHTRKLTTSSEAPPAASSGWWWFQSNNKENVDTLLHEDDRADTVEEEQDNIHNRCMFSRNLLKHFI